MARVRALVEGRWHPELHVGDPALQRLRSAPSTYREWVTPNGRPGPEGQPARPAEPGRYHLYVSYACPWAHRAILYRRLKGLETVVSMSVLHPRMAGRDSWRFDDSAWSTVDHLHGHRFLHEVYARGDPHATTVVTVPMLWDRATGTIVNRESGDILRILERAFDHWGDASVRFRPPSLTGDIERMNTFVLERVCTAVYRVGFAPSQAVNDREVVRLFEALDALEEHLAAQPYLLGHSVTEPDWHLFCTLVRFDAAYHPALRCSRRRLTDYPALAAYTRRLYDYPGVADTVDLEAIRLHYFDDHPEIDRQILPAPPAEDFRTAPDPLTA
ncbi:glutathione S-transferase C-terminal domain-containing protein [Spiribacter halobius]|uniref:glutathione S-transferase family protein n=1 Tax=Sediminicurvatus halobius TaxID=2182432 RepID=UPI001E59FEDC|nr:glutathione S-transferase C-terminal domain-containing protein [Spiribacter halobius]UEX77639.1 glutathione S-transferase C-terminal domain-containing protein [Spiribacter halobius]